METRKSLGLYSTTYCSYPTYEEWKPRFIIALFASSGSYPTYEEWKPAKLVLELFGDAFGSYPTYEEWKPFNTSLKTFPTTGVLILPMRNGNNLICPSSTSSLSSYPTYEEWKQSFSILFWPQSHVPFLSYL